MPGQKAAGRDKLHFVLLAHANGVIRNMNSAEYKAICTLPNVLSKDVLVDTQGILKSGNIIEAYVVARALLEGAVEFPENHNGDSSATFHKVTCSPEEADNISDYLFEKEAESVPVSGIATSETSRLVTLVNVWHELADYV